METITNEQQQTSLPSSLRLKIALAFCAFIMIGASDGALGVLLPGLGTYYNVNKATT